MSNDPSGRITYHKTFTHSKGIQAIGDVYDNTVESAFSLLKCGIVGTLGIESARSICKRIAPKWRSDFNRRKNLDLFLGTLRRMVTALVLTFEKLTA